jgi:alkanesulfonate monooxygenase SsuD/methylene tetrahydromethanopterin reductase-like flavin-dependent oxidoreductase (luciferase family)
LILKAWTADRPFSFDGKRWQLADYTFFPKPLQKPHPLVFALGAITRKATLGWADRHGVLHPGA